MSLDAATTDLTARPADAGHTGLFAQSAVLAALCRFVPVPLLDDYLEKRVKRSMTRTLLQSHRRDFDVADVSPLYESSSRSVVSYFNEQARKVLLWPMRRLFRTVFWVLGVRSATLQLAETLLLGRTIDRCLGAGKLPNGVDAAMRSAEAQRIREAFDQTLAHSDWRYLRDVLGHVLTKLASVSGETIRALKDRLQGADPSDASIGDLPTQDRGTVQSAVNQVQQSLAEPKLAGYLSGFDAEFDRRLAG